LHGKRDFHEILKKAQVDLSLGAMGIESWCMFLVFWFWVFVIVALDLWFWLCFVRPCHFGSGVIFLALVFMIFFLFVS